MWVEKARKDNENLEGVWCVIELMGHIRLAGKITEKIVAGYGMLEVNVPRGSEWHTEFINPASLYRLTPASEGICREIAGGYRPAFQPIIPATATQIPERSSWVDQDEDEPDDVDWQENYNRPDGKDHPIYWSVE